ncbi:hypothetical protein PQX77_000353 [Marasmius sp. AFHP31]|nr:hypothetical protein PQX77_000353 [Marasmius sp. AFHP31]
MSVQSRVKAFESLGNGPSTSASVDLKDWNVLDDPPLINLHSDSPPTPHRNPPPTTPKPGSLTVEQHTYPPARRNGHAPASSISSFHSVSLSDDDRSTVETADTHFTGFSENASQTSLDDSSFENVSTTESMAASPISAKQLALDWEKNNAANTSYKPRPPKLPQRPGVKSTSPPATSGAHLQRAGSSSSNSSDSLRIKSASSLASSSSTVILSPSSPVKPVPSPIQSSVSGSWTFSPPNRTSTLPAPASPPPQSNTPYSPYLRRTTSNSSFNSLNKQKPPPPPVPRSKPDIFIGNTNLKRNMSQASTASTSRPTPVPPAARRRFEAVFEENVKQARRAKRERVKTRALEREKEDLLVFRNGEKPAVLSPEQARKTRNSGWRGLSIDLVTGERGGEGGKENEHGGTGALNSRDEAVDRPVETYERLEGGVVKLIWSRSRLPKERLKEIWAECDPNQSGSLDKGAFVNGMWRIDEELRKAQRDPTKYVNMKIPPVVNKPTRPPSLKAKPKQPPPNPTYPPALPIRPPPRPISPISHSPTSSTSSFTSLGGSSLSSGPHSLSVSPSPPNTFGSYVAVGRVNANGGVGTPGSGINAGARRKPPPPPVMPLPLPSPP